MSTSATVSSVADSQYNGGNVNSNGHANRITAVPKLARTSSTCSKAALFLSWVRFLLMDAPLLVVLLLYASVNWFDYVHRTYILRQAQAFYWSPERTEQEHTYYNRYCDANDLSTNTTADLFVPSSDQHFSPQDAAAIQLKHGFTFIENVLSPQTMQELRDHIDYKNHNDKQLFVISAEHRFNILLGTEERSVRNALIEVANHQQFRSSLEAMLGPNPALVELTAITSSAGAKEQYWHEDVNEMSSATNYMQSFGPVYSVFIQLQNTTKAMGATSICPGSHYCSQGPVGAFCEAANMKAVNPTSGFSGGDALIMNMNSFHRGSAHVDPTAPDRIMLILSFTPKPARRAERRQLSSGFTYQLRWDMWGHTLNDMATAHTSMRQPWATLRSLGLYKPRNADWGIDYIMQSTQRIAHHDNGFAKYNLEEFIEEGGFPFIPTFLEAKVSRNESWQQYLTVTLNNCIKFTEKAAITAIVAYAALAFILWVLSKPEQKLFRRLTGRFSMIMGFVGTFIFISKHMVDQSDWAKDIVSQQKFTSTVPYDQMLLDQNQTNILSFPHARNRTTLPNRFDVLIETRFGSWDLGPYNHFLDGHPGNIMFRGLIDAHWSTYNQYSQIYQEALAQYIREMVEVSQGNNGRFLYQFPNGMWGKLNATEAEAYIAMQLWLASHPAIKKANELIRYGVKDLKYGIYRDAALARHHIPKMMKNLQNKMLRNSNFGIRIHTKSHVIASTSLRTFNIQRLRAPPARSTQRIQRYKLDNIPKVEPVEPSPDAWIQQGEIVEVFIQGFWYGSEVLRVTADGYYHFVFIDGDSQKVTSEMVRRVRPVKRHEMLEVFTDDGLYHECEILEKVDEGNFVVKNTETNSILQGISPVMWRRKGGKIKVKPNLFSSDYPPDVDVDVNDLVEVYYDDNQWYTGTITDINVIDEENEYKVSFIDGTVLKVYLLELRKIKDYEVGEVMNVFIDDSYYECEFLGKSSDGTYRVRDIEDNRIVDQITPMHIARKL